MRRHAKITIFWRLPLNPSSGVAAHGGRRPTRSGFASVGSAVLSGVGETSLAGACLNGVLKDQIALSLSQE